jgi:hypothetical protein
MLSAQCSQNCHRVLSHRRDGVHARLDVLHRDGRKQGAHLSNRRINVAPALACLELGMLPKLLQRVQVRGGNLGRFKSCRDLLGGQMREHGLDRCVQSLPVCDPPGIGAKALISRKFGILEDTLTKGAPFPLVLQAQEDRFPVLG